MRATEGTEWPVNGDILSPGPATSTEEKQWACAVGSMIWGGLQDGFSEVPVFSY